MDNVQLVQIQYLRLEYHARHRAGYQNTFATDPCLEAATISSVVESLNRNAVISIPSSVTYTLHLKHHCRYQNHEAHRDPHL